MKRKLLYVFLVASALSTILSISSCKNEDTPSATEVSKSQLTAHAWKIRRVTIDGVDHSSLFADLSLQWRGDNRFSTVNGGVLWPASGTWSFADETGKALRVTLNGVADVPVTIETLDDTRLVLSLFWNKTTLSGGRTASIAGDHTFEFEVAN